MATDVESRNDMKDQSAASLVTGILDDVQHLMKQQVALAKREIADDLQKASEAAQMLALGAAVFAVGTIVVVFGLVHLIHWASLPSGVETARIPLWAAHLIVGVPLALLGGGLTWASREKLNSIHPLEKSASEMKENVKLATNSK